MGKKKAGIELFGIMMLARVAYQFILRPMVQKAIDDPDEDWDDTVMEILDRLFNYTSDE